MAQGELTPEEASSVAAVLEIRRKALETVEIEKRVAALEQRAAMNGRNVWTLNLSDACWTMTSGKERRHDPRN